MDERLLNRVDFRRSLRRNIISCSRLDDNGIATPISNVQYKLIDRRDDNRLNGRIKQPKLYDLFAAQIRDSKGVGRKEQEISVTVKQSQINGESVLELWHRRMAHPDKEIMKRMKTKNVYGMKTDDQPSPQQCEKCMRAK